MLRYTAGYLYFWNGFQVVPVFMGLFAIPEVIDLAVRGGTIAKEQANVGWADVWEGIKDTFKHWSLVLRCSAIGTALGLVPGSGLGRKSVHLLWPCQADLQDALRNLAWEALKGLIAPESGNNAKEGGSLFTALAFGLPSGAPMVIILAALMVLGIKPGSEMITKHLDLFWTLVVSLIVGNIIASWICILSARALAQITFVKGTILVPIVILLVILGAYGVANDIRDVVLAFVFGGIGYVMKKYDYSRVTLTIGFVLGDYVERYFLLSLATLGPGFLLVSPIALGLLLLTLLGLPGRGVKGLSKSSSEDSGKRRNREMKRGSLIFAVILLLIAVGLAIVTMAYPLRSKLFPLIALGTALILLVIQVCREVSASKEGPLRRESKKASVPNNWPSGPGWWAH